MRPRRLLFSLVLTASLSAGIAAAQATRTWVSGVGDDANPCSRTAPCKTFAGAISKTATGGEINALDPGGFGGVTITKAITIDGGPGIAGVLVAGTNGIIVNITTGNPSDVVVLRNLDINGVNSGFDGIKFLAGAALHVQNVTIREFTGAGINFNSTAANAKLFVSNASVLYSGGGIKVNPSTGGAVATIENTTLSGNLTYGLRVEGNSSAVAKNTTADGNLNGFYATEGAVLGGNPTMSLETCVASHNSSVGVKAGFSSPGLATVTMSNTQVFENATGLSFDGNGQILSFGNNRVSGNTMNGAPSGTVPAM